MMKLIINKQTEPDGKYHIHTETCPVKPEKDYIIEEINSVYDAANILKVDPEKVAFCRVCFDDDGNGKAKPIK